MNHLTRPPQHRLGWFYRWSMAFIGLFDRWLHLSCRAFIQVASEKYDRPLSLVERIRQALHRAMCRVCRIQEQHMDQIHTLAKELAHPDEPSGAAGSEAGDIALSEGARARIRRALKQAVVDSEGPLSEPGAPPVGAPDQGAHDPPSDAAAPGRTRR